MSSTEPHLESVQDPFERVEGIVALFEAAQQRGENPAIEAFLPADGESRRAALVELIHSDLEFRLKQGETVRVESYLARFPEFDGNSHELRGLIVAEFEFRGRRDPDLTLAEYLSRFPELRVELPKLLLSSEAGRQVSLPNSHDLTLKADHAPPQLAETFPQLFQPHFRGYEIIGELGRGGMGVVYRARDTKRREQVALKTLQWIDAGALYRFKQEFRALADVSHPNLVTLHELVADGERWFFSMELVDGVDFYSYVRPEPIVGNALRGVPGPALPPGPAGNAQGSDTERHGGRSLQNDEALTPDQVRRLRGALLQLTEGLLALHEAGKLHRDIKPRNVLVTREGRVVLLDFGLTADLGRSGLHHSTERHIIGTVSYMSPEQAEALAVSAATDWFSVGVMLYEVLTAQLPRLDRSSLPEDIRPSSSSREQLQPPIELVPETPLDLNEICVELLRTDPAARLSGRELLSRLKGSIAPGDSPAPRARPAAPFIGRQTHLAALRRAFESVRGGKTEVVFVQGHSGAGKSALIQHFLSGVESQGPAVILAGRCYERESVPYKALDSAVDALTKHLSHLPNHEVEALLPRNILSLARVFPVLRRIEAVSRAPERGAESPDPQEVRRRAFSALRELLARLGDRHPLVLYIDDLQWGDLDSAELLTELLRPPDPPAMLLLGCYRTEGAASSPLLTKLAATPDSITPLAKRLQLDVGTLSSDEAREFALLLIGDENPLAAEQAAAVARESRGNPFFVQELVQYLQAGSGLSDRPSSTGDILLDKMLWERVQRLPEEARRLLEVLAVAGQPLRPSQAGQAASAGSEPRSAILALRTNHLIRAGGSSEDSQIEPYHDRIRETIVSHLAPERLREHHLQLARTLEAAADADPEMLAIHYQGAGELEAAGAAFARAAANAADALAFEHATRLYRLSLKLRPITGNDERELLIRLGDALANAGRGAEAAQEFLKAAATADKQESLALQRRAAEQYMISGHIDEGLAVLGKVLAAVGLKLPATPRSALFSLLANRTRLWFRGHGFRERAAADVPAEDLMRIDACWSVVAGLSMVDTIRGADFQTRQFLYSLRAGEPGRIARALAFEAGHVASEGGRQARRAESLLQAAEELAERVGLPHPKATAKAARGVVAALLGRWPEARASSDEAEIILREQCTGAAWELGTVHRFAFWARIYMGELREIASRLPTLLKDARERNDLYAVTNLNNVVLPMLFLAADEPDRIAAEVYEGEQPQREGFHVQHYARLFDLTQTDLYCGRGLAAWERVERQWPLVSNSFLLRVQQIRVFMLYLRGRSAIQAAGEVPARREALLRAAERDADRLAREGMLWAGGLSSLLSACLFDARGQSDAALERFGRAAEQLSLVSMGLHAAAARRRQGLLLGGDAGAQLICNADAWMTGQTVRNPARLANMLAPGGQRQ